MKKFIPFFFLIFFYNSLVLAQKQQILVPYTKGNLTGLSDTLGNIVVKPQFDRVIDFYHYYDNKKQKTSSLFYVIKKGKKSIVDEFNKIIPLNFSSYDSVWLTDFSKEYFNVRKNSKNGILFKNKIFIPCKYDDISYFVNNSFEVKVNKKKGVINSKGKLVVPVMFDLIYYSAEGNLIKYEALSKYESNEYKIYYDSALQAESHSSQLPLVGISSRDMTNEKETEPDVNRMKNAYDSFKVISYYDPCIYIYKNGLAGVYNTKTNLEIIKPDYEVVRSVISNENYTKSIYKVTKNNLCGLFENNKELIKPGFDEIDINLDLNSFQLKKNGLYGLFLLNTTHPYIKPLYKKPLKWIKSVPVTKNWSFNIYNTELGSKNILVGENGVNFYEE